MRVLIVSYVLPFSPSGVRFSYTQLAENLISQGHEVDIITPMNAPKLVKYPLGILSKIFKLFGSKGKYISSEISSFTKVYFSIKDKGYDIVNAQDAGSAFAATLALKNSVPVILTCRFNDDPATEVIRRNEWDGLFAKWIGRWYKFQFSKIKYYTGVSDYVLRKADRFFPEGHIKTKIHNAIDFKTIAGFEVAEEFKNKVQDRRVIMNIGFLEKRKNQRYFIGLAEELRKLRDDFVIVIVGEGIDYQYLVSKVKEKKLEQYFIFTGQIQNVFSVLKAADIYFHTALNESFGRVLIEATACKVPVFAFPVGGIPEILKKSALIDSNQPIEKVADFFDRALNDNRYLDELKTEQYNFAYNNFTIHKMILRYIDYYGNVVEDFKGIRRPIPDKLEAKFAVEGRR